MNTKKFWKNFLCLLSLSFLIGLILNYFSFPGFFIELHIALSAAISVVWLFTAYTFNLEGVKIFFNIITPTICGLSLPYLFWGKQNEFKNIFTTFGLTTLAVLALLFLFEMVCLNDYKEKMEIDSEEKN